MLRELTVRYPGTCVICAVPIAKGTRVLRDDNAKNIRCLTHASDSGDAPANVWSPPPVPLTADLIEVPGVQDVAEVAEVSACTP